MDAEVAAVPNGDVTTNDTEPIHCCAGTDTVSDDPSRAAVVTEAASDPNVTDVTYWRFPPRTVMVPPPVSGPLAFESRRIDGAELNAVTVVEVEPNRLEITTGRLPTVNVLGMVKLSPVPPGRTVRLRAGLPSTVTPKSG